MTNPTTHAEQFAGSSGAFAITGPERYDDGLWLEEGTTNLLANPGAEGSFTSTIINLSGATITPDTTEQRSGAASAKVVTNGAGDQEGVRFLTPTSLGIAGGVVEAPSIYVKGAGNLFSRITVLYTDASFTEHTRTDFVASGGWQRVTPLVITTNVAKAINQMRVDVRTNGTQAVTFWCDDGQIENKPYATSFVSGTRAASSASISPTGILDPDSGSLAFRFRRLIDTGGVEPIIDCGDGTSGKDRLRVRINASDRLEMSWQTNGAAETTTQSVSTIAIDTEYLVYVGWNGIATELSIDNGTKVTGTRDTPAGSWGTAPLTLKAQ